MEYIAIGLLITVLFVLLAIKHEYDKNFMFLSMKVMRLETLLNELKKTLQTPPPVAEPVESVIQEKAEKDIVTVEQSLNVGTPTVEFPIKDLISEAVTTSVEVEQPTGNVPQASQDEAIEEKAEETPASVSATVEVEMQQDGNAVLQEQYIAALDTKEAEVDTAEASRTQEEGTEPRYNAADATSQKKFDYEAFIGGNLFGKIGILVFVVGIGFFVKYAIDQNWINEVMRTVLGFVIGAGMLTLAHRLKTPYRAFSSLLAGGGCAVFYVTVAMAYHYYHLFSSLSAFAILVSITVFMVGISLLYDRRELAITALVGGFVAPFIASTGEGNYNLLLLYLGILNVGMAVLALYRQWGELPLSAFLFTASILFFFEQPLNSPQNTVRLIFGLLFCVLMSFTAFRLLKYETISTMRTLLYSLLFINSFFCLYNTYEITWFIKDGEGHCCLFLALLHLVQWFLLRSDAGKQRELREMLLALGLTFATVSLPMFFEGDILRLFWAVEMVLLLWLYVRSENRICGYATVVVVTLVTLNAIYTFFETLYSMPLTSALGNYLTWLLTGLAYFVFAYLMQRHRIIFKDMYSPWNALMYLASILIIYYHTCYFIHDRLYALYNIEAMILFSTLYFLLVAYVSRHRFAVKKYYAMWGVWLSLHVVGYFVHLWCNVTAYHHLGTSLLSWAAIMVLTVDIVYIANRYYRETEKPASEFTIFLALLSTALWLTTIKLFLLHFGVSDFSAGMSLGLPTAAFVQMYCGMRKRCKELRVMSIALFVFVLVKLVLNDVWDMPALGRIIVFITLGLLLLILSFLYQRLKQVLLDDKEKTSEQMLDQLDNKQQDIDA